MAQGTTVLGQLLALVPSGLFDKLATQYMVNKGVRKMTARAHFAVMLFAQLAGLPSLRKLETATSALTPTQRRYGLIQACRSTLAEANLRIPWQFYRDLFQGLLAIPRDVFPRHEFDLPGKLFSLDSTVVPLCLSLCQWAEYRTRKGGMKLHTLLDHDGYIPSVIRVTPAKVHDMVEGRKFRLNPGDTLLFDRGYFDSAWFQELNRQGVFFVTRIKSNITFEWTERRKCDRKAGIRIDWIGTLGGSCGEACTATLRLVRYRDQETGKELEFLTNLLEVNAKVVADLYRERWQIEQFFKWVKQNLKIKTYLGTDLNAVLVQVWIAMIAYLLIKLMHQTAPQGAISAQRLLTFIATRILLDIPIRQAWQDIQRTKRKRHKPPKTQSRTVA
jgi:putative transposase